jgi:hypothetical protein
MAIFRLPIDRERPVRNTTERLKQNHDRYRHAMLERVYSRDEVVSDNVVHFHEGPSVPLDESHSIFSLALL